MASHVKVLGILHIALGSLAVLAGLVALLVFGGLAGLIGVADPGGEAARIAVPLLGSAGGLLFVFLAIFSLPGIVVGIGLLNLQPWARTLGIVISGLSLLNFPLGSLLGAYGLWVLLQAETERMFAGLTPGAGRNR